MENYPSAVGSRCIGFRYADPLLRAPHTSITAPVVLRSGERTIDLIASLDTGASYCLFETVYAAELGLDLTTGVLTQFRTANGSFEAYGHEVEIDVLGIVIHSLVYFFAEPSIRKNVLGRGGWLDRVCVGWSIMTVHFTLPHTISGQHEPHRRPRYISLARRTSSATSAAARISLTS